MPLTRNNYAVHEKVGRFEDALRMIRAVRLAATLDFTIEPATRAAIEARAELAAHLSGAAAEGRAVERAGLAATATVRRFGVLRLAFARIAIVSRFYQVRSISSNFGANP